MKFVKFSIFALTMGLFVASCGNSSTENTETTDTTATMAPAPAAPATPDTAAAMPADTMHHDSTMAPATPAK